jgi:isoleucyl-tRNA synthetase
MAETRGDWCISRQRSWGVPIPAFYRVDTQEAFMTPETIAHIEQIFRQKGSDSWWQLDIHALLPASLQHMASKLTKGSDTMDVWFDSGTSWAGVLQERASEGLNYPADLYLEGSDQHRGWFQSSLLTSVASQDVAPYKTVLTHGFVLDANGHKMSKSLGNVVDPRKIIEGGSNQKLEPAYGADTLRLWVASVDYSGDVCVGDNILKHTSETYRKLRNTLRYLVGSLHGFEPARDAVPLPQLASIDQYVLGRLSKVALEVQRAYDEHQFYKAHHAIMSFATTDLSAFYLDICKDRLYVSHTRDWRRLSCQTVMKHVLEQLSVLMAPLVPHMAEDVWQSLPYKPSQQSVFQQGWPATSADSSGSSSFYPPHDDELWQRVRTIRHDVNKCIERMRTAKEIGASQECQVFLCAEDPAVKTPLRALQGDSQLLAHAVDTNGCDDLRFVFIASQVTVVGSASELRAHCQEAYILPSDESQSGLVLGVARARGTKCQRCWYYSESVGKDHEHVDVCLRCADVIRVDKHRIA